MNDEQKKMQRIQQLREELDSVSPSEVMLERQARFKELTRVHGVNAVALAAGLTVSSLTQHLRVKHPQSIGEKSLNDAEKILKKLK